MTDKNTKINKSNHNMWLSIINWLSSRDDYVYVIALCFLAIVSHLVWFIPGTTLFNSDWLHWSNAAAHQFGKVIGVWNDFNSFGNVRPEISFSFVIGMWSILIHIGSSFDTAVKITLMIPSAILGFLSPYILIRRLIGDKFISFVSALFYGSTTYFLLLQTAQMPIVFVYALAPLLLYLLIKALDTQKNKDILLFAVAYSIGIGYEVRIMFIVTLILLAYIILFIPKDNLKKIYRLFFISALAVLLLNLFWILPFYLGNLQASLSEYTARELFGNWLFDLPHAITISKSSWTGGTPNTSFEMQPVLPYLYLIPIIAIIPLTLLSKTAPFRRKQLIFFLILALAGIFLTKQSTAPIINAYSWFYVHLPGFSLFREASKFYLLTAFGYLGLLSLGLKILKPAHSAIYILSSISIIIVASINLKPLIDGEFGSLFVNRHQPAQYERINNLISSSTQFTRTLWVPADSQWAYYDLSHPKASAVAAMQQHWMSFLTSKEDGEIKLQLNNLLTSRYSQNLINNASIKYLIVPLRDISNDDDQIKFYGNDRQYYIDILGSIPWLKRVNFNNSEIAIYENTHFRQYVSGVNSTFSINKENEIPSRLPIISKWFGGDFDVIKNNKSPTAGEGLIRSLFDTEDVDPVGNGELTHSMNVPANSSLYVDGSENNLSYKVSGNNLTVNSKQLGELKLNGKIIDSAPQAQNQIASTAINQNSKYYFGLDSQLQNVDVRAIGTQQLGSVDGVMHLYDQAASNLIKDPSLENGLWQKKVQDCNHYDDNGLISMSRGKQQVTDGDYSLKLESYNHIACTGQNYISVKPGAIYSYKFDYRNEGGQKAGYKITFDDPKHTVVRQDLAAGENWQTLLRSITVPNGASHLSFKVYGYQGKDGDNDSLTYYDNFGLHLLNPVLNIPAAKDSLQKIPVSAGHGTFTYHDKNYPMNNLINNGSFSSGLWQRKVGDCNNYDDSPQISMDLYKYDSDSNNALQLEASNHTACTSSQSIDATSNSTYVLSFDYQSPNSSSASYNVSYNDPTGSSVSKTLTNKDKNWHHYSIDLHVPAGATKISLTVYASPHGSNNTKSTVHYDNFKLVKSPPVFNHYFVVTAPATKVVKPKNISYTISSPTKKLIQVSGATTPFYLAMSESYDAKWQLELNNSKVTWYPGGTDAIPASDHIDLNDFENGWYVDPAALCTQNAESSNSKFQNSNLKAGCTKNADGSYDLSLVAEFAPQRLFYLGSIISSITLLSCIGYLGYTYLPKRSKSSKHSHYIARR